MISFSRKHNNEKEVPEKVRSQQVAAKFFTRSSSKHNATHTSVIQNRCNLVQHLYPTCMCPFVLFENLTHFSNLEFDYKCMPYLHYNLPSGGIAPVTTILKTQDNKLLVLHFRTHQCLYSTGLSLSPRTSTCMRYIKLG